MRHIAIETWIALSVAVHQRNESKNILLHAQPRTAMHSFQLRLTSHFIDRTFLNPVAQIHTYKRNTKENGNINMCPRTT